MVDDSKLRANKIILLSNNIHFTLIDHLIFLFVFGTVWLPAMVTIPQIDLVPSLRRQLCKNC